MSQSPFQIIQEICAQQRGIIIPPEGFGLSALLLDVTVSETYTYGTTSTEYPIEDGSIITDHVRNMPVTLQLDGFISGTQMANYDQYNPYFPVDLIQPAENRIPDALDILMDIYLSRQPSSIIAGLQVFQSMILTSLSIPRNKDTGDSFRFSSSWKQIVKAKTGTVSVAYIKKEYKKQGANKKDAGVKPVATAPTVKVDRGIAAGWIYLVTGNK